MESKNPNLTNKFPTPKIKICGLFREDDIVFANKLFPDFVGFVFAKSRRMIDFETAANFRKKLDKKIKSVGVFVNENPENIIELYRSKTIDIAQLHGNEDDKYIEKLKKTGDLPVIKAVKPGPDTVLPTLADWYLFDNIEEENPGGTGKTFDWSQIPKVNKPIFLAGGLNSGNILRAISTIHPFSVDISSGVEVNGHKDFSLISEIINLVRGKNHE